MEWTPAAQEAMTKVPFFVRKRVRKRVEEEALHWGANEVKLEHVRACQKKFLDRMEDEVKGYRVETCFGATGCPNRAVLSEGLAKKVEALLAKRQLKTLLREKVKGPLKFHHELGISLSDCPNACSRPQIADIGLMGACKPKVVPHIPCSQCEACVEICEEGAVSVKDEAPLLDTGRCVSCGKCIGACPTGTLQGEERGYRIVVGGKLGRHPRLGVELPGISDEEEALQVVHACLDFYQRCSEEGERLGKILERSGGHRLLDDLKGKRNQKKVTGIDLSQGDYSNSV